MEIVCVLELECTLIIFIIMQCFSCASGEAEKRSILIQQFCKFILENQTWVEVILCLIIFMS